MEARKSSLGMIGFVWLVVDTLFFDIDDDDDDDEDEEEEEEEDEEEEDDEEDEEVRGWWPLLLLLAPADMGTFLGSNELIHTRNWSSLLAGGRT